MVDNPCELNSQAPCLISIYILKTYILIDNPCGVKKKKLAYLGAIIDGEGSISIVKQVKGYKQNQPSFWLKVEIGSCDPKLTDWLKENFDGSTSLELRSNPNHKNLYRWQVSGKDAKKLLIKVRDYLLLKTVQADLAIKYSLHCSWKSGQLRPLSLIRKQERYWEQMRKLNHKGK